MRILKIRFKNLNSLAGEWEIDFTDPAYTSDGIFAITGPTGAGKTTLLDAMCLALYGQTPRLGIITGTSNEIMTRQTGECFAEVTFSTQQGRYLAQWAQRRALKRPGGKLQRAKQELFDADSGQIIDSKLSTVGPRIIEITGMDFSRFTQSMMLAQGGFAVFLRAGPDERAPILEKITGTAIYSQLSITVHERLSQVRQQLDILNAEQQGMRLLTADEESELRSSVEDLTDQLQSENRKVESLRQYHQWKLNCEQLSCKLAQLTQELDSWQQQDQNFRVSRDTLAAANRALELSGQFATLDTLRHDQQEEQQQLRLAQDQLPELVQQYDKQQRHVTQSEKQFSDTERQLNSIRPVFKQTHVLDSRIHDAKLTLQNLHKTLQAKLPDNIELPASNQKSQQRYQDAQKAADLAQQHLTTLTRGKTPGQWRAQLDGLSDQLTSVQALRQQLGERTRIASQHHQLLTDLTQIDNNLQESSATVAQANEILSAHKTALRALQEQHVLQQRVIDLESLRSQLVPDEPCPLCGANDHPYAEHVPDINIDALQTDIRSTEQKVAGSEQAHAAAQKRHVQLSTRQEHLVAQRDHLLQSQQKLDQAIESQCEHLQIGDTSDAINTFAQSLQQQKATIAQALQQIDDGEAALKACQRELQIASLVQDAMALKADIDARQNKLSALQSERHTLLQDKDVDQEESRLQADVTKAQQVLSAAQRELQQTDQQCQQLQQQIRTHQKSIDQRVRRLKLAEADFSKALGLQQFNSEQSFLAAQMPEGERKALEQALQTRQRQGIELRAALTRTQQELDSELTKTLANTALTNKSLEALQQQLQKQEASTRLLQEKFGALRQSLKDNDDARRRQQKLAEKIDQQKLEVDRWGRLHQLIGSGDGKKFRNFAQGLTFELMIQHANVQLQKMTDRYLLIRDREQPLDLNVVDNYQAGEIRSTKNLSGGESFLVSLALALGLSRMASRNVRVDSLFLDEGFGTLDDDALDMALETLTSLQQEGKLIGVISHVAALKERIATQINVHPLAGGHSNINGPGVRRVTSPTDNAT